MSRDRELEADKKPEWAPFSVDYGLYSPLMSGSIDGTDTRPHDRGVVRAIISNRTSVVILELFIAMSIFPSVDKPNKHVTGDPKRTVFVARLSHDTSEGINLPN